MSKYEIDVWEYADEFKNLDTNETFYGYQVCELLEHKDQQISDLETKLVESESKRKSLEEKIKFLTEETEENFVDGQKYNQLKQQLHGLPKKIVEEISKELESLYKNYPIIYSEDKDIVKSCYDKDSVNKILDTILKKYGGEDE